MTIISMVYKIFSVFCDFHLIKEKIMSYFRKYFHHYQLTFEKTLVFTYL